VKKGRVYLIGFMGAGKTHTGRRLARLLEVPFIDLDQWIEEAAGRPITEIFAREGETGFREREREALHRTAGYDDAVVATGGGLPCFFDNLHWMNQHGLTIYLQVPPLILRQRLLRGLAHRPLLTGKDEQELQSYILDKLQERSPYYQQAEVIYQVSDEYEDIAGEIFRKFLQITGH
jgi:shikimate kinase